MATDEEYLDNLLKSLTENEQQIKTMEETLNEMTRTAAGGESPSMPSESLEDVQDTAGGNNYNYDYDYESQEDQAVSAEQAAGNAGVADDILADFFAEALSGEDDVPAKKAPAASDDTLADFFAEALSDEGAESDASTEPSVSDASGVSEDVDNTAFEGMEDWQSGLDDLLAKADQQANESADSVNPDNMDVTELIDHMESTDADLAEINGLLKGEEAFDVFAENASKESSDEAEKENGEVSEDSSKKGLFSKGKSDKKEKKDKAQKKKRSKRKKGEDDLNTGAPLDIALDEKKPGLFSKMLDFLTREDEDSSGSEGDEILDKINKENEKRTKKEEKKRKKAEKKKGKQAAAGEDDDVEAGADTDKKKKKKEKKEKKEKKKKEKEANSEEKEKPVKVLSRKNLLVLIAACATLLAGICALSSFLTEYSDKQNARQAFYDGDYEEVYRLLYHKNLNSSDSVIYNRVKTVLTIERKLDSYENNLAMNRKLEALDALMQGVRCYQELKGVDEYGVRDEVEAIYQQICSILENNYGITLEKALEINAYDNETYTRVLDSAVNGTEFTLPGEETETEEELPPQDILVEEEEIISY